MLGPDRLTECERKGGSLTRQTAYIIVREATLTFRALEFERESLENPIGDGKSYMNKVDKGPSRQARKLRRY